MMCLPSSTWTAVILGLLLLVGRIPLVAAQCEVEFRQLTLCVDAEQGSYPECIDCVDSEIGDHSAFVCSDIDSFACPGISSFCCEGCIRSVENALACEFNLGSPGCRFFCGFENDAFQPTECAAEIEAHAACFDDIGSSTRGLCIDCLQNRVDTLGTVNYCGQYSDILCPVIENECAACQGCERATEDLLACNFASGDGGCPFYCGLPCFPRPTSAAPMPSPPIVCEVSSTTSSTSITFEAEDATNLVDSSLPGCECCRITDDTRLLGLGQGYVKLDGTDGTTAVTYFDEDDYLAFGPVDFGSGGNCATILLRYARGFEGTAQVLLRLDSPTGPFVGEVLVTPTLGWSSYEVGETAISVSGEHTLFLVGEGGLGVMNLDWIQITYGVTTNPATTEPASIPTPAPVASTVSPTVPVVAPVTSPPTGAPSDVTMDPTGLPVVTPVTSPPTGAPSDVAMDLTGSPVVAIADAPTDAPAPIVGAIDPTMGTVTDAPSPPTLPTPITTGTADSPTTDAPTPVTDTSGSCIYVITFWKLAAIAAFQLL